MAAPKNAEGSTPDRTPSTPDVTEVAPTGEIVALANDDGPDNGGVDDFGVISVEPTPDVTEVAPTGEIALANDDGPDNGGVDDFGVISVEHLGELRVGPTFVAISGTYYNVDRIESISVDQDGRTLMSLIGVDRAIVLEVSIDELLDTLGIDA